MSWMEDKLDELAPVSEDEKVQLNEIFDRVMSQMVDEAWKVNQAVAGAMEEGCAEARYILESLKVQE